VAAAVRGALEVDGLERLRGYEDVERLSTGTPPGMGPVGQVPAERAPRPSRGILARVRDELALPFLTDDWLTWAQWPDFLDTAWRRIREARADREYPAAQAGLLESARFLLRVFPQPVDLSPARVRSLGENPEKLLAYAREIERAAALALLNVAILEAGQDEPERLARSPFPAEALA